MYDRWNDKDDAQALRRPTRATNPVLICATDREEPHWMRNIENKKIV